MLRMTLTVVAVALLATAGAVADPNVVNLRLGDPGRRERQADLVLDGITDTRQGDLITPAELARRLAGVRIVFVGEDHTDMEFHRVQQRVIEELHRTGRPVLIGAEMFPYTEQAELNRWNEKLYTEAGFLELGGWYEHWGYRWEYYRDIFVYARDHGIGIHGINIPRDVIRAVRTRGFSELTPEESRHIPIPVDITSQEHRTLFRAYFPADDALHGALSQPMWEGMYRAQATWDAAMGWNAVQALQQHGGANAVIVVLIGAGHVAYGLGAQRQIGGRFDGATATVMPVPVVGADGRPVRRVQASYADFVWGVPQETAPLYPTLGVSLAGSAADEPTRIIEVEKGSAAAAAGLRAGDVLTEVNGQTLRSLADFRRAMHRFAWGDVAELAVRREERTLNVSVVFRRERASKAS